MNTENTDDELVFYDDENGDQGQGEIPPVSGRNLPGWKILIVDDDPMVHSITTLVLKDFSYDGRGLEFIHAHNGQEAREMISTHPDTAIILLDVVMETVDSGLQVVEYIRKELKNFFVRIILRTGQPGQAPEEEVIVEYDINDYKEKTELSSQKLFTIMVSSLRTYRDILTIEANREGLKRIIDASASLFELRSMRQLASGVLTQLVSILHMDPNAVVCEASGVATSSDEDERFEVLAATGRFEAIMQKSTRKVEDLPLDVIADMRQARVQGECLYFNDRYVGYFKSEMGVETVIYCEGWNELTELNKNLIEIFCTNVHIAFENTILNKEIEDSQKEIICTLGEIAEARSKETGCHVKRVSEYCRVLGEKYGLGRSKLEILRLAAPMHDVGKVAIPDAILNNPGPLSDEEFETMKNHALIGSGMLGASNRDIMKAAAIIAVQHHEKYDGTGYPDGLQGEQIHIFARIVAIADVFDALCSDRVYRKAYTMDTILEYFRQERGKHFDPQLVDLFLGGLDEVLQVKERFSSEDVAGTGCGSGSEKQVGS